MAIDCHRWSYRVEDRRSVDVVKRSARLGVSDTESGRVDLSFNTRSLLPSLDAQKEMTQLSIFAPVVAHVNCARHHTGLRAPARSAEIFSCAYK
jgi:hypothetical protein